MQQGKFYIAGLDLYHTDRESPLGVCRVLENLRPSGSNGKLSWTPVEGSKEVLTGTHGKILSGFVWNRNNYGSLLLTLEHYEAEGTFRIMGYHIFQDDSRTVITDATAEYIYLFAKQSAKPRTARFAQIGDKIVVSISYLGSPEALFVVSMDGDTIVATDFNLPPVPQVTLPPDAPWSDPGAIRPGRDKENRVLDYYFGFRFGWELTDGSIVGLSGIRIGKSGERVVREKVSTNSGGIGVRPGSPGVVSTAADVTGMPIQDATSLTYGDVTDVGFYGVAGESLCKVTPPTMSADLKKVIRGIAVFISDAKESAQDVYDSALYFHYGTIENLFDSAAEKTLLIDIKLADHLARPVLDADWLTSHHIYAAEVHSYNRALILGNVSYDYQRPANIDGTVEDAVTPPAVDPSFAPPANFRVISETDTGDHENFDVVLAWDASDNPDLEFTEIRKCDMIDADTIGQVVETYRVLPPTVQVNTTQNNYHLWTFRARHHYRNNVVSEEVVIQLG